MTSHAENPPRNSDYPPGSDPALIDKLVTANHILYDHEVLDAWGHVSVRDPERPDRFWMARSIAPAFVTAPDVMEFDIDSEPVDRRGRKVFDERFIHGEIYRARPDVRSVVHHHSPNVIPFANSDAKLRAMLTSTGFLRDGAPVFNLRDVEGGGQILITNRKQAAALAAALADRGMALLRSHGAVVVGDSVEQIVWRGIYAEKNAKLQWQAMQMGHVYFLTPEEAAHSEATSPPNPERSWNLWKHEADKKARERLG